MGLKATYFFEEGRPVTWFSAAQLVLASGLCGAIFRLRRRESLDRAAARDATLWLLFAVGGAYLAVDELVQIHERIDFAIHAALGIPETILSDRLDDAVILVYSLIGFAALYAFRGELRALRPVRPLLRVSIVLFFLAVIADALTDNWGIKPAQLQPPAMSASTGSLLKAFGHAAHVLEDALKLATECVAIAMLIGVARPALTQHEIAERN